MMNAQAEDIHQQVVQLIDPEASTEGQDALSQMKKFLQRQKIVFQHAKDTAKAKQMLSEKAQTLYGEARNRKQRIEELDKELGECRDQIEEF